MSARIREPRLDDLRRRREELLEEARASFEELAERAANHELIGDEWRIWDELEAIEYLLEARLPSSNGHGG